MKEDVSGWGRYPMLACDTLRPADKSALLNVGQDGGRAVARGAGRSYGDAAIGIDLTIASKGLDRLLEFDAKTGQLVCEAGLLLTDLLDVMLPRGWIVPVTPGTRYVTIGGMIAADVHGKNHHVAGSFCDHVDWIDLMIGDGRLQRCSRDEHADLFAASCGGMGLTGIILRAAVRMKPVPSAFIRQRTIRAPDLAAALAAFEASMDWTYSVAWIDCLAKGARLGRSAIFLGEHAAVGELPEPARDDPYRRNRSARLKVPVDMPTWALSSPFMRGFNSVYYAAQKSGESIVPLYPYFYPLDAIGQWNRIYGRRGFVQYQCVIPLESSEIALRTILTETSNAGSGSFLAVLKRMGAESFGLLSFPKPGYTLALDFPVNDTNLALLDRLDAITAEHGGRIYLAKDARAKPSFARGYPRIDEFRAVRDRYGLTDRYASRLSQRLEI